MTHKFKTSALTYLAHHQRHGEMTCRNVDLVSTGEHGVDAMIQFLPINRKRRMVCGSQPLAIWPEAFNVAKGLSAGESEPGQDRLGDESSMSVPNLRMGQWFANHAQKNLQQAARSAEPLIKPPEFISLKSNTETKATSIRSRHWYLCADCLFLYCSRVQKAIEKLDFADSKDKES